MKTFEKINQYGYQLTEDTECWEKDDVLYFKSKDGEIVEVVPPRTRVIVHAKRTITFKDEELDLRDCVELMALGISQDLMGGQRNLDIVRDCKILDTLTNALKAII